MSTRSNSALALMGALALFSAAAARADVVTLKNGDKISGTIKSAEAGKLVMVPDFAAATAWGAGTPITINQSDIATFSSTAPLVVKLKNGSYINQAAQPAAVPGHVQLAGAAPVALDSIDKINPNYNWTGTVGLNAAYASGPTTTTVVGLGADGLRRTETDRIIFNGAYNYGTSKAGSTTATNANNWNAELAYNYFFQPQWYGFGDLKLGADQINYLTLRAIPSLGIGYQWIDRLDFHFNTEAGIAYLYEDYSTARSKTESAAGRIAWHIDRSFNDNRITLFHDLALLDPFQNTKNFLILADAGARVALTKAMFSEARVNVTYDNKPAPGTRDMTTLFLLRVGLAY